MVFTVQHGYCNRLVYEYVNNLEAILGYSSAQIHKMLGIKPLMGENEEKTMDEDKKISEEAEPETDHGNVFSLAYPDDSPGKLGQK